MVVNTKVGGRRNWGWENSFCCRKGWRLIFVRRPLIWDTLILARKGISPSLLQNATVSGNKHQRLVAIEPDQPLAKLKHNSIHNLLTKKMQRKDSALVHLTQTLFSSIFPILPQNASSRKTRMPRSRKQRRQSTAPNLQNANRSQFCSKQRQTIPREANRFLLAFLVGKR